MKKMRFLSSLRVAGRLAGFMNQGSLIRESALLLSLVLGLIFPSVHLRADDAVPPPILPDCVWAAPGHETNMYFNGLFLSPASGQFLCEVTCDKGAQLGNRWTWIPKAEDAGDLPWSVEIRDLRGDPVANGRTKVKVARADSGAGRSIRLLAIGDSLTRPGIYAGELIVLFEGEANPLLTLLGTNKASESAQGNVHEGYGGWTWERFLTQYNPDAKPEDYGNGSSPFVFLEPGKEPTFDFLRYIREACAGVPPDFVTIFTATIIENILRLGAATLLGAFHVPLSVA